MGYSLVCKDCGLRFKDEGFDFSCPNGCSGVISTRYDAPLQPEGSGIWRYINWLPVKRPNSYDLTPVLLRSDPISSEVGAEVYLAFHGYFPEMGAKLLTCTFKEVEAVASLRYAGEHKRDIAVASAGNAANAFLRFSELEDIRSYIFIPERVFGNLFCERKSENSKLIIVKGSYDAAQDLARKFSRLKGIAYEGGGLNIARRDALATLAYHFHERYGFLPDEYYQSVGSGTGAIAFYEGSKRLIRAGAAKQSPKIVVAQNEPFAPIVDAWNAKSREIAKDYGFDPLEVVYAKVLTNKSPIYSARGGLYDIMSESKGHGVSVSEKEAKSAGNLFIKAHRIGLDPAAEVGLAALLKSRANGRVLLNITGAGYQRLKKDVKIERPDPDWIVEGADDLEMIR